MHTDCQPHSHMKVNPIAHTKRPSLFLEQSPKPMIYNTIRTLRNTNHNANHT